MDRDRRGRRPGRARAGGRRRLPRARRRGWSGGGRRRRRHLRQVLRNRRVRRRPRKPVLGGRRTFHPSPGQDRHDDQPDHCERDDETDDRPSIGQPLLRRPTPPARPRSRRPERRSERRSVEPPPRRWPRSRPTQPIERVTSRRFGIVGRIHVYLQRSERRSGRGGSGTEPTDRTDPGHDVGPGTGPRSLGPVVRTGGPTTDGARRPCDRRHRGSRGGR
jgi:hypothetical protein